MAKPPPKARVDSPLPEWLEFAKPTARQRNARLHWRAACASTCKFCWAGIPKGDLPGCIPGPKDLRTMRAEFKAKEREASRDPARNPKPKDRLVVEVEAMTFGHPKGDVVEVLGLDRSKETGRVVGVTFAASWWTGQRFTFQVTIPEWRRMTRALHMGRARK